MAYSGQDDQFRGGDEAGDVSPLRDRRDAVGVSPEHQRRHTDFAITSSFPCKGPLILHHERPQPFTEACRRALPDERTLEHRGDHVTWRNWEASYDVSELEPRSRAHDTYVLQEYFLPVDSLAAFVPRMAKVFRKHDADVVNVSIRHALPDTGSFCRGHRPSRSPT